MALMTRGVHIAGFPGGWVSAVHNEDDYQQTITGFDEALSLVKKE
jgi:hypothetical protein